MQGAGQQDGRQERRKARGLAGFIIDGAVRDAEALRQTDFPVYSRAVSPNGPYKDACGEINVPVSMGNVVIQPGDLIMADADGIVCIRRQEATSVAEQARKITEAGLKKLQSIEKHGSMDMTWLYDKLAKSCCDIHS